MITFKDHLILTRTLGEKAV